MKPTLAILMMMIIMTLPTLSGSHGLNAQRARMAKSRGRDFQFILQFTVHLTH